MTLPMKMCWQDVQNRTASDFKLSTSRVILQAVKGDALKKTLSIKRYFPLLVPLILAFAH
jgi:hypothetical protein